MKNNKNKHLLLVLLIVLIVFGVFFFFNSSKEPLIVNELKINYGWADFSKTVSIGTEKTEDYKINSFNPTVAFLIVPKNLNQSPGNVSIESDFNIETIKPNSIYLLNPKDYSPGEKNISIKINTLDKNSTTLLFLIPLVDYLELSQTEKNEITNSFVALASIDSNNFSFNSSEKIMREYAQKINASKDELNKQPEIGKLYFSERKTNVASRVASIVNYLSKKYSTQKVEIVSIDNNKPLLEIGFQTNQKYLPPKGIVLEYAQDTNVVQYEFVFEMPEESNINADSNDLQFTLTGFSESILLKSTIEWLSEKDQTVRPKYKVLLVFDLSQTCLNGCTAVQSGELLVQHKTVWPPNILHIPLIFVRNNCAVALKSFFKPLNSDEFNQKVRETIFAALLCNLNEAEELFEEAQTAQIDSGFKEDSVGGITIRQLDFNVEKYSNMLLQIEEARSLSPDINLGGLDFTEKVDLNKYKTNEQNLNDDLGPILIKFFNNINDISTLKESYVTLFPQEAQIELLDSIGLILAEERVLAKKISLRIDPTDTHNFNEAIKLEKELASKLNSTTVNTMPVNIDENIYANYYLEYGDWNNILIEKRKAVLYDLNNMENEFWNFFVLNFFDIGYLMYTDQYEVAPCKNLRDKIKNNQNLSPKYVMDFYYYLLQVDTNKFFRYHPTLYKGDYSDWTKRNANEYDLEYEKISNEFWVNSHCKPNGSHDNLKDFFEFEKSFKKKYTVLRESLQALNIVLALYGNTVQKNEPKIHYLFDQKLIEGKPFTTLLELYLNYADLNYIKTKFNFNDTNSKSIIHVLNTLFDKTLFGEIRILYSMKFRPLQFRNYINAANLETKVGVVDNLTKIELFKAETISANIKERFNKGSKEYWQNIIVNAIRPDDLDIRQQVANSFENKIYIIISLDYLKKFLYAGNSFSDITHTNKTSVSGTGISLCLSTNSCQQYSEINLLETARIHPVIKNEADKEEIIAKALFEHLSTGLSFDKFNIKNLEPALSKKDFDIVKYFEGERLFDYALEKLYDMNSFYEDKSIQKQIATAISYDKPYTSKFLISKRFWAYSVPTSIKDSVKITFKNVVIAGVSYGVGKLIVFPLIGSATGWFSSTSFGAKVSSGLATALGKLGPITSTSLKYLGTGLKWGFTVGPFDDILSAVAGNLIIKNIPTMTAEGQSNVLEILPLRQASIDYVQTGNKAGYPGLILDYISHQNKPSPELNRTFVFSEFEPTIRKGIATYNYAEYSNLLSEQSDLLSQEIEKSKTDNYYVHAVDLLVAQNEINSATKTIQESIVNLNQPQNNLFALILDETAKNEIFDARGTKKFGLMDSKQNITYGKLVTYPGFEQTSLNQYSELLIKYPKLGDCLVDECYVTQNYENPLSVKPLGDSLLQPEEKTLALNSTYLDTVSITLSSNRKIVLDLSDCNPTQESITKTAGGEYCFEGIDYLNLVDYCSAKDPQRLVLDSGIAEQQTIRYLIDYIQTNKSKEMLVVKGYTSKGLTANIFYNSC